MPLHLIVGVVDADHPHLAHQNVPASFLHDLVFRTSTRPPCMLYPRSRYRHLIETLDNLGSAAEHDPDAAATLLSRSHAQDDIDTMLALLRAEERSITRSEHGGGGARKCSVTGGYNNSGSTSNGSGVCNGGADGPGCSQELLATPCLELLLEERVVKHLCELGASDKPRGTMALVLGACASLLEQASAQRGIDPSEGAHWLGGVREVLVGVSSGHHPWFED